MIDIQGKYNMARCFVDEIEKSAREQLSVDEYAEQMEGIYTTCVGTRTIDEAPMAYKDGTMIERLIAPTAEIISRIKPVYNYKAG